MENKTYFKIFRRFKIGVQKKDSFNQYYCGLYVYH